MRLHWDLSNNAPHALESLEARARDALSGDMDAWYDIAFALLQHSPALGILVGRGSFHRDRILDNETVYDAILDARDDLGVDPDEPYAGVLDTLTERSTQLVSTHAKSNIRSEPSEDLLARARSNMQAAQAEGLALEQQLRQREQAFQQLEARFAALQQQVQPSSSNALLDTVTKLKAELEQVQGERRSQRARIEELKSTIREGAEQRRGLRKQVAEALSSNDSKHASATAESPTAAPGQGELEARLLDDVAEQSRQPLRHLIIARRAHDQLVALPRDVATRALTLCATLAAGQTHAFVGVKKLKRVQEVYSARVDLSHRLLFLLSPTELHVTDVIERRDLEHAIERLRG